MSPHSLTHPLTHFFSFWPWNTVAATLTAQVIMQPWMLSVSVSMPWASHSKVSSAAVSVCLVSNCFASLNMHGIANKTLPVPPSSSPNCSLGAIDLSPSGAHLKLPAPEHRAERHAPRLGSFEHSSCGLVWTAWFSGLQCCHDLATN